MTPNDIKCPNCDGVGKIARLISFRRLCPHCDGRGVITRPSPPPMPPIKRQQCFVCTCLGKCRGASGLGERWYCAITGPTK